MSVLLSSQMRLCWVSQMSTFHQYTFTLFPPKKWPKSITHLQFPLVRWARGSPDGVCGEGIPSPCVLHLQNRDLQSRLGVVKARSPGENHCEWHDVDHWSIQEVTPGTDFSSQCPLNLQVKDRRFEWTRDKMLVLREVTHADQGLYAIKLSSGFTYETVHLTVSGNNTFPDFPIWNLTWI